MSLNTAPAAGRPAAGSAAAARAAPRGIPMIQADTTSVVLFLTGFVVPTSRLPGVIFDIPSRIATFAFDAVLVLPFALAILLIPPRRAPADRLIQLGFATVASLVISTLLGLVTQQLDKKLTIVGSTAVLCTMIVGSYWMAEALVARRAAPLLRGLQAGFLLLGAYIVVSGAMTPSHIGEGLAALGFFEVQGINRNTITAVGLMSLAAAFSHLVSYRKQALAALALDLAVIGLAVFLLYRIPGKGAWLSAAILFVIFVGMLARSGRMVAVLAALGAVVVAAPIAYERISAYLLFYMRDAASTSFSGRTELWWAALDTLNEKSAWLLGFGYDAAYGTAAQVLALGLPHFHNELINALFCGGVLGAALLMAWVVYYLVMAALGSWRVLGAPQGAPLVFSLLIGIFLLTRFVSDVTITSMGETVPIWLVCTAMVGLMTDKPRAAARGPRTRRRWSFVEPPRGTSSAG